MNIRLRDADPQTDYERIAELLNEVDSPPVSAEQIREWDQQQFDGARILHRRVAVGDHRQIVGYGVVNHFPWQAAGDFIVNVMAEPTLRRQGIGAQLFDDVLALAHAHGARRLKAEVRDDHPEWLRFAEQRGFYVDHHVFESTLDLASFDAAHYADVLNDVAAQGIRIFSLAEAPFTTENFRKLWEVNVETARQDPASDGTFPDFDAFQKVTSAAWFRPEGQILAADGDRYIGLSAVGYFADGNAAYNNITGVLEAYRGRRIALAMKVRAIQAAQRWGVERVITNNDSVNAPMLAINRRLGYVPQAGVLRLVCDL
jgi:GNAT superfamily N-acetyltransferase